MNLISKVIFTIFILAIPLCKLQNTEEIAIDLDQLTEVKTLPGGVAHYYKIKIPENATKDQFLIFDAFSPVEDISDPDIFISEKNSKPTSSNSEWNCQSYGQDTCVVPKEVISPGKTFHASIYCAKHCTYRLMISLKSEIDLEEGDPNSDKMEAHESRLYKFTVPPSSKIRSISVSLNIAAENVTSVHMYVAPVYDQNSMPSSTNSIRVLPTWLGLQARMYDGEGPWFCTNCTYKVLITTNSYMEYTLTYTTNAQFVKLKQDQEEVFDLVRAGERNCYRFRVKEASADLEVGITPFSGDPDIYISPGILPEKLEDFPYNSKGSATEALIITSKERKKHAETKNYFVCIAGEATSAYHMAISAQESEDIREYTLSCGYTQTMQIDQGDLMVFEYSLSEYDDFNITLTLASIIGDADLYVKFCSVQINDFGEPMSECALTKSDFHSKGIMKSTNTASIDMITYQTNPKLCEDNKMCSLLVGVFGVQDSRFSLTASCADERQIALAEGQPIYSYVDPKQYVYFVFTVFNPLAKLVKIQLSSMSGDADLYVSRINPNCDSNHAEYSSNLNEYMPDTVIYNKTIDGQLNTTYYVSVYGSTYAVFTLSYTVTYEDCLATAIQLYDGSPMIGTINGTESVLYKFNTGFYKQDLHDIRIFVSQIHGAVIAYAGVDYIPSPTNFTWSFDPFDSTINIRTDDPEFRPFGEYNILLQKYDLTDTSANIFAIKYTTGMYMALLLEGFPESGNMTNGMSEFYKYYIHDPHAGITVTVTPLVGDPDLYISVNSSNRMPTRYNNDYYSAGVGADSIKISSELLMKRSDECTSNLNHYYSTGCAIYISVNCAAPECSYTLQVSQDNEIALKLIEGIPQFGTVTSNPQFYIVVPDTTKITSDPVIMIQPTYGKIKAYALLISLDISIRQEQNNMPSPTKYDVASIERAGSQAIVIPQDSVKTCGSFCQFLIGVYHDNNGIIELSSRSDYVITAASTFQHLINGMPVIDNVPQNAYKYYHFRVPCNDCIVTFSLTPLSDGDPDLYVNKGSFKLPSETVYDFKSTLYRGDFLQLSPKDIWFVNSNKTVKGTYTIAVFGKQNCTYSMVATTSAETVEEVYAGVPVHHEQDAGKISFFGFNSWRNADIKVSLKIYTGRATIRANVISSIREVNVLDHLPTTEYNSLWSSQQSNTISYLMIRKQSNGFKADGTFIIAIETLETTSYDLNVEYETESEYSLIKIGEPTHALVTANTVKKFGFIVANNGDLTISLSMFYGSVNAIIIPNETESFKWTLPENGQITIKQSDNHFKLGMYYIEIKATTDSEFTIGIEQGSQITVLTEGQPYSGSVTCGTTHFFLYRLPKTISNERATKTQLSLYVKFFDPIDNATLYLKEISKSDNSMPSKLNSFYMLSYDPKIGYLGDTFDVEANGKELALGLDAKLSGSAGNEKCAKFEITAWTTGVVTMSPDMFYMNSFTNVGDTHIYEFAVKKSGVQVYVEATPCLGEIEFYVGQTLSQLTDRKYDLKKTELNKGRLFGTFTAVSKGKYYIAVKGVSQGKVTLKSTKGIWYSIRAFESAQQDINEIEDYSIEDYGNILYTMARDEITLNWGKVLRKDNQRSEATGVSYDIYVGEEGQSNMFTACGMKFSGATLLGSDIKTTTFSARIPHELIHKQLLINIIARLPAYGQTIAYNPLSISSQGPPGNHFNICIFRC